MENEIVNPETLKFRRAVKDAAEAHSIAKRLIEENRERNNKAAAIMRKYNDEQPWNNSKLKAAGESWRHNRSTGFLSSMVKRILPPYVDTIDSARFLTSSALKDNSSPSAQQKSDDFRLQTTNTIRQWDNWHNFKMQAVLENVLFGYATANWSDEHEWRPTFCRGDEALFPDGCPQFAKEVPVWARRQNFLIHELAEKVMDKEHSEQMGWNIDNLVKAINTAQPANRREGTQDNARKFEDQVREGDIGIGRSYMQGVQVVLGLHLFIQEATGKVSHYLMEEKTGDELMVRLDRFESMDQCLALLSVDIGNGKLHGSKGAGRVLYNTHVGIEQARNLIADNLYLSGLLLLKATQKGKTEASIRVLHPVCIVNENYEVIDQKFQVNAEAFFALDRHMSMVAEMQVGAFMPGQMLDSGGEKRTASEINYTASIEQQIRVGVLTRFYGQFLSIIAQMQKRIYSIDNIKEAKKIFDARKASTMKQMVKKIADFVKKMGGSLVGVQVIDMESMMNSEGVDACVSLMEKGLTAQEIYTLAQTAPNATTEDMSKQNAALIDAVVARYMGNAGINQIELMKRDIASKLGNSIAEELVIPGEDNTIEIEAVRMQLVEITSILGGEDVPVSPRDADEIHMKVMLEKMNKLLQTLTPAAATDGTVEIAGGMLRHFDAHIQQAAGKGASKEALAEADAFSKGAHQLLDQLGAVAKGAQAQAAAQVPAGAQPAGAIDAATLAAEPVTLETTPTGPVPGDLPLSRGAANLTPTVNA